MSARLKRNSSLLGCQRSVRSGDRGIRSAQIDHQLAEVAVPGAPEQLGDARFGAGHAGTRHRPGGIPSHQVQADAGAGQPLPHDRIVGEVVAPGEIDRVLQLAGEADLLGERGDASFEPEQSHRHAPTVAPLADEQVRLGDGVGEEGLVELAAAGDLHDLTSLDAGLVHRHEQEAQAAVPLRARFGPGDDEAPVAHVGERRPHLLPVDHPLSPSSTARVATLARSLPASGSL